MLNRSLALHLGCCRQTNSIRKKTGELITLWVLNLNR
uniref:Uncharacterized protein n=1 Tax=Arundo donax TaxID=35708 RepID=A0A0A9B9M9_ARUDO